MKNIELCFFRKNGTNLNLGSSTVARVSCCLMCSYLGERSVNITVLTCLTSSESSSFTFMMLERSWCFKGIIIESVGLLSSQSATVAVLVVVE